MKQPMLITSTARKVGRDTEHSKEPFDRNHRKAYDKADALVCLNCSNPVDCDSCHNKHIEEKRKKRCQDSTAPLALVSQTPDTSFQ